jgi:hypothetical protein
VVGGGQVVAVVGEGLVMVVARGGVNVLEPSDSLLPYCLLETMRCPSSNSTPHL